ncbi:hypothetical protein KC19_6G210300 [Ceratodon purpureus]|uniref:Uncharacterized protein n=1 Tax=Ceratodon purpureus TaxID=3225 RepID=A0A8T0HK00_CERPU|nr:hypothetical protein KC19_6G210300 [Ceratodon purpureus]
MAMATAAAMGSTALASPVQLQSASVARSAAACPGLASRSSVAFSGFNGAILKVNNAVGRIAFSNSSRLSVKAAMEVDISKIVPQADRVLIRLEALESKSAGGVLLPSAAVKYDRYLQGEVFFGKNPQIKCIYVFFSETGLGNNSENPRSAYNLFTYL